MSKTVVSIISTFISLLIMAGSGVASAHNKVVVVPLAGDDLSPLANIITVAKSNGDFSDPSAALASISDSSSTNPYLVVIAPGVYTLTQPMDIPKNVTVAGSGRFATILKGAFGNSSLGNAASVVIGSGPDRAINDLSVINTGSVGETHSIGIYVSGNPLSMNRLYVETSGSQSNTGIFSSGNTAQSNDVEVKAFGGSFTVGLNSNSDGKINSFVVNVSGGSISNYGVYILSGSSLFNNLNATATGTSSYGVYASGFNPSSRIDNSILKGDTKAIRINGAGMRIVSTQVDGGITDDIGGSSQCLDVYSPDLIFQSC